MMMRMLDTVHQLIAHVHVHMCHIYFSPQYFLSVFVFAFLHLCEEFQIFFMIG